MTNMQGGASINEILGVMDKLSGADILAIRVEDRGCRDALMEIFLNGGIEEAAAALGVPSVEREPLRGREDSVKAFFWAGDVRVYTYEKAP